MSQHSPNVAVIGCGYWGKNLVRNFRDLGALKTVCDLSDAGRAKAKELAPEAQISGDIDEVLASDVEGVVIATPAETHHNVVKKALLSGKDVFVEKPMALRQSEAEELVALAQRHGRMLMVGHVLEYHPAILKLRELIDEGRIGKIQYVYSNRLNLGKIRREENILWSFAPHDIAIILRLMGGLPLEVIATGGAYVQANIADVTVTNLLFDNNVRAHIYVSWLHPFKEQRLVVVGSKGMISFCDVTKDLIFYDRRVELGENGPVPVKGDGHRIEFEPNEPLREECDAFLTSIATRQPALTDSHSGLDVLKVLQAAQRSLITNGQPVLMDRTLVELRSA